MTDRFLEFRLFASVSVMVDCKNKVEYLKTACSMVPICDRNGQLILSALPSFESLDRETKKIYRQQLKERFVRQKAKTGFISQAYLLIDQESRVEYLYSGYQIVPLIEIRKRKKARRGKR